MKNYATVCELAHGLVQQGFIAFKLCGGFSTESVALVKRAVQGKAAVGVV